MRKEEKPHNVQSVDAVLLHRLQHQLHVETGEDDHQIATPNHDVGDSDAITVAEWNHASHDLGLSGLPVMPLKDRKLHDVEDETVVRYHGEFLRCRLRQRPDTEQGSALRSTHLLARSPARGA